MRPVPSIPAPLLARVRADVFRVRAAAEVRVHDRREDRAAYARLLAVAALACWLFAAYLIAGTDALGWLR